MNRRLLWICALFLLVPEVGRAELKKFDVLRREPFAGGMAFGDTGPYEKIVGVAHFAVDPKHPRNRDVVDLSLAPRNADGKVEFASDVFILAPKDPAKGNHAILYDVNNRGNKLALGFFNRGGGGNDPTRAADAGDGFLFRRGYTVVWCGWIGELLPGNNRLLMKTPVVTDNGKPIRGLVRYEMVTDSPAETLPLSRREGHGSYPPTAKGEAERVLTWRVRESDERVPIPRSQWSLERIPIPKVEKGVQGTLPQIRMRLAGGFRPGYLYELVCEAEGPIVQGLGFVAVRDLVSFLRYGESRNGKPDIERAYGFGVSQSGRFLRNFLHLGFNADENDRKVFDGLIPHVAGGGLGFFNFRFAQPTRHNAQHEEHLYSADRFPFTYGELTDPFTTKSDAILKRLQADGAAVMPKVMHTQSTAEYWHRSGSLVHTDPLGTKDAEIPENVRIYAFGGTQHGPAGDPPSRGIADNLANPGDYKPLLRALLDALDAWVRENKVPPPNVYPRLDNGTLVDWQQKRSGFPAIPGVRYPEVIQQPPFADHGPEFFTRGIATIEPPRVLGHYTVKVPRSGPDGNDLGTLLPPEVAVPLATYTGWNLRRRDAGAEGMLVSLAGSYIPFAKTAAGRKASGDPRPSIEERYGSFEEYRKRFADKCREMVKDRYLLPEDAELLIAAREKKKEQFAAAPAPDPLHGAKPLTEQGDLAAKMVDGIHKYLDRATAASVEGRKKFWKPDFSSAEAYAKSVQPNRERLKKILGVVDERLPVRELEYVGGTGQPSLVAETDKYKVHTVRWPVFPGVDGEGLLLEPKKKPVACLVAVPHSAWTPEMIAGLASGLPTPWHSARIFAENGCRVLVPTLIDRKDNWSGNPRIRMTNEPHREFLYRMLYQQGRHLLGLEIQKILAALDWLARERGHAPLAVHGFGDGGMLALFSGAFDSRIATVAVSSYFGPREGLWQEPIDRNIESLASLVLLRRF